MRRAQSFNIDEVELASNVFMRLLSGSDVGILVNNPNFRLLAHKFLKMRTAMREEGRISQAKAKKETNSQPWT